MRSGGSYVMQNGKPVAVESPTAPHPEGNAPRDAAGRRLDRREPGRNAGDAPAPITEPAATAKPTKKGD